MAFDGERCTTAEMIRGLTYTRTSPRFECRELLILLAGGDKHTQANDIRIAQRLADNL